MSAEEYDHVCRLSPQVCVHLSIEGLALIAPGGCREYGVGCMVSAVVGGVLVVSAGDAVCLTKSPPLASSSFPSFLLTLLCVRK